MGVAVKHGYGFAREADEIFSYKAELGKNVRRDSDDVASRGFGLKNIEQFAWAGP